MRFLLAYVPDLSYFSLASGMTRAGAGVFACAKVDPNALLLAGEEPKIVDSFLMGVRPVLPGLKFDIGLNGQATGTGVYSLKDDPK